MTDYDLGKAHGTVVIDYDGRAVTRAKDDVDTLGEKTLASGRKIKTANEQAQDAYDALGTAVKQLASEVDRYAAAEFVAKAKVSTAEKALAAARASSEATAKQVKDAERALQQAQTKSSEITRKLATSTEALKTARQNLNSIPVRPVVNAGDASTLERIRAHMANVDSQTRRTSGGLNLFTNRLKFMAGGIALATPGIAGLGVSLVALTGLAGVAAGAIAALGATAATLAVGTAGISDVFKAAAADSKAAGAAAASSAKQQRAAAQAIESAKRSLSDAEENLARTREEASRAAVQAERAIVQAQRDLLNAQRDALRAQDSLTRARREATRQLEDMRLALTGGALDERQAVLDVAEAQAELNRVLADPTANESDRQQAILNLEKQQHALAQTRLENQRLGEDQKAAAAKGVAGSDAVISAQDAVRSSTQQVADAQQSVVDAQEAARLQQVDSARAIRDAVRSVSDAQRQLIEAYADSADAAAGGASKTADAMSKISPNARAVVSAILDQRDAWQDLKFSVQDRLFAGLADDVAPLAEIYFPLLKEGMGGIADGLNGIIKNIVEFLKSAEAVDNIRQIFGNTGLAVGNLGTTVRDLLAAFLDIAAVASDFLPGMATNANNAASGFRKMISDARETGKLKEWMQGGIDATSQLWELLKNVGSIIGTVFSAFDQEGGGALNTLTALTGKIEEFLKSAEGQEALHALGRILASIGGAYGKVFLSFLETAADVLVRLEPFIVAFADAAGTYLAGALQAIGPILNTFAEVIGFLGPALGPVVAGIYAANKAVDLAKVAWGALNVVMRANPFILIATLVITLVVLIIQNWDTISAFLSEKWQWIKDRAKEFWDGIQQHIVKPIQDAIQWIEDTWNGIGEWLIQKWTDIKNWARDLWNGVGKWISDAIQGAKDRVQNIVKGIVDFFMKLPGRILDFLKSLPGKLANWAMDLINGIIRGLGDAAYKIWEKLKSIISDAWDNVMDFFGISSPSRLAMYAGEMVGRGLANGIAGSAGMVAKAAGSLADAAAVSIPGMDPNSPSGLAFANGANRSATPVGLALPATRAAMNGSSSVKNVTIERVEIGPITGNLDPTNPVAWRRAMVGIKDGVRQVERDYA